MRLIFLSWAYPPIAQPRAVQVARLARALGRPVELYCSAPAGTAAGTASDGPRDVHRIADPGPSRAWERALSPRVRRFFVRPDPEISWAMACAREIAAHAPPGPSDIVVTFGQPMSSHLAGLTLKRRFGNRWIAHFSDPWADNPMAVVPPLHRLRNRGMERRVLEAADRVLFTSQASLDLVMSHHEAGLRGKAGVLPHGFDETLYPPRGQASGPIMARYLGALYGRRGPRPLLDGLRLLARDAPTLVARLKIEFIGVIARRHTSADLSGLPAGAVTFGAPVDYAASLALMRSSDLLLHLDQPARSSPFLASKLVDYLGARRPVVGITPPGTAAGLIRAMGGWVADPASPGDIATALAGAVAYVDRRRDGDWGDDGVREHYRIETVAAEFGRLVDVLAR